VFLASLLGTVPLIVWAALLLLGGVGFLLLARRRT